MSAIEKEVDSLGRVVIPINFRRKLGIEANSKVTVSLGNGVISIFPLDTRCALCGKAAVEKKEIRLCEKCILKIKAY